MKLYVLIQLILIVPLLTFAQGQSETMLYPIVEDGRFGYIDENGSVVIKPQFNDAKPFHEGLARVKIGAKWGFINRAGNLAILPQFELNPYNSEDANYSYLDFHEGLAAISLKRGEKWGYIDHTGKIVIPPKYDVVTEFSEGLALVGNNYSETTGPMTTFYFGGAALYIDKTGKPVALPVIGETFSEGLAIAETPRKRSPQEEESAKGKKVGYIDKRGRFQIAPRFWVPHDFSEGLARVRAGDRDEWGYINHKGTIVIQMKYEGAGDFSEGLARVLLWERMGFVTKSGMLAIKFQFTAVGNFYGGLASACVENEASTSGLKCGYIDRTGKWAIQPAYSFMVGDFKGSLAFACTEERCGYINRNGKLIWSFPTTNIDENPFPNVISPLTGCSILSDKADMSYPCTLNFRLF